jgi:hypothetical protein
MRTSTVTTTWICDYCSREVLRPDLDEIFIIGRYDGYCRSCPHTGMDICRECQQLPVQVILEWLRRKRDL